MLLKPALFRSLPHFGWSRHSNRVGLMALISWLTIPSISADDCFWIDRVCSASFNSFSAHRRLGYECVIRLRWVKHAF
ncbi:hypothetical protein AMECASPLE_024531 [Ameca splendens]|uniref:Secreted protein n=1 Tax=Ameca splendens TaxID=208324 RepID=A0ABV0ZR52_9TELE